MTLRRVLTSGLQAESGGWPHKLDVKSAATSIVSTAHVVEMLRLWSFEYDSREIQSGLAYLARQVVSHTQPATATGVGRGECTRFPVYALWGLTRFLRAIIDPQFEEGLAFAVKWLTRNELKGGGWPVHKGLEDLSFTMVTPAVNALDRLRMHHRHGGDARELARRARVALASRANVLQKADQAWWTPYDHGADPSAAATILAVLTLSYGTPEEQELAAKGANWLMTNPGGWVREIEPDRQLEDRQWTVMSFSLGLRAVLNPRIGIKPTDPTLRPAIQHLSNLWVQEKGGWAEFRGWRPTTTGCYAVVAAVDALKQACDFDPDQHLLGLEPREASLPMPHPRSPLTLTLSRAEQHVVIENTAGACLLSCFIRGRAQWTALMAIAQRHASAEDDQAAQAIPLDELAEACRVKVPSVARTVRRLNKFLTDEAAKSEQFLQNLVEHIVPGDTNENRYGLEQVEVVVINGHREI